MNCCEYYTDEMVKVGASRSIQFRNSIPISLLSLENAK